MSFISHLSVKQFIFYMDFSQNPVNVTLSMFVELNATTARVYISTAKKIGFCIHIFMHVCCMYNGFRVHYIQTYIRICIFSRASARLFYYFSGARVRRDDVKWVRWHTRWINSACGTKHIVVAACASNIIYATCKHEPVFGIWDGDDDYAGESHHHHTYHQRTP